MVLESEEKAFEEADEDTKPEEASANNGKAVDERRDASASSTTAAATEEAAGQSDPLLGENGERLVPDDDDEDDVEMVNTNEDAKPPAADSAETQGPKPKRRRKRKETAEEREARKLKMPKGMVEEELMENDADRSEESSLSEVEEYFDLVKKYTTKKTLPAVDHSKIDYKPFTKNFYIQVKEITAMKDHEVEDLRRTNGDIRVHGRHCPRPIKSFLQCGLVDKIVNILQRREYDMPFPIQMQAIPALMCGRDIIGVAQTGSGKTLAYILPMLRHVLDQEPVKDGEGPIGFAVAPTRELALQIHRELQVFGRPVKLRCVCTVGGAPLGEQLSSLKKGCEIITGTPGRLIDVLTTSNGKITNLRRVTFMVIDEADRMFDMGFEPQIGMFLQSTRPDKQVALFSATLPTHVEALARQVLKKPLQIVVGERNTAATNVKQFVEVLEETQKFYRLLQLLGEWHEHGSNIIFVGQQRDVDEMFTELLKYGYPSLPLHGGQDHEDRDFTLQDFKDGVANTLIATSLAARGIDVKSVILVVNFKAPDHLEDYIHRIGRTGRAGKKGFAFTFITPDEGDKAQDLVDALRQCGQEVPEKLRKLAEEYQSQVNMGQASKRSRWSGFGGGRGYRFDNTEKSRQQKERTRAKKEALIGNVDDLIEEEEFKDPWDEPDKSSSSKAPPPAPSGSSGTGASGSSSAMSTTEAAQEKARSLGLAVPKAPAPPPAAAAAAPAAATGAAAPPAAPPAPPAATQPAQAPPAPTAPPKAKPPARAVPQVAQKSDKEIEDLARCRAEEVLKNKSPEERAKKLPELMEKLKQKLKAEAAKAVESPAAPPPPPPPKAAEEPVVKALPKNAGVAGVPIPIGEGGSLISKSIEQLQIGLLRTPATASTVSEAERLADMTSGAVLAGLNGQHLEEFEINDYPQVARQKISHRDPLLAIEEMTGAKCQVKGQHFSNPKKMPEGARKLYVEIVGPTSMSVQKAKTEVKKMMEALAIRTLNIPGMTSKTLGVAGRYDPRVGK